MSCMIEYDRWKANTRDNPPIQQELADIAGNQEEIEARFGSLLEFGTGGLRGLLGAGLSRMNIYTVRQATQGLANVIVKQGEDAKRRGVVIAYDCRHMSKEFSDEAACVLAAAGIVSYLFDELRPTPELSFSIRELHAIAGINVTASHNPKEYNGYKVYWEDGGQLPPAHADEVLKEIRENDIFNDVRVIPLAEARAKGLVKTIGKELDEKFMQNVLAQSVCGDAVREVADDFRIIYTPFHGAGYRLVPQVLRRLGFKHVIPVPEQMVIDGSFPTVKSPNPEEKAGFKLAIELAGKEDSDLIIGTDPDADRAGIVVRNRDGEYVSLTGNQVGVLLTDFIINAKREAGKLPADAAVVSTIVSTRMAAEICRRNGVQFFETLTGFKFIGEKILEFEETGKASFLFGFEESYGYLTGTYARDKDSVVASMLISEMAAWYKRKGMTLYDALEALYAKYGYYAERNFSNRIEGNDALERMGKIMQKLRAEAPKEIAGVKVAAVRDYLTGVRREVNGGVVTPTGLPKSNVLYYEMADGNSAVVRPSGTEPKVKVYLLMRGKDQADAAALLDRYEKALRGMLA